MFQAAADKLKREMKDFGYPPQFPVEETEEENEGKASATPKASEENKVDKKGKSKKVILKSSHRIHSISDSRAKPWRKRVEKSINGKSCEVLA